MLLAADLVNTKLHPSGIVTLHCCRPDTDKFITQTQPVTGTIGKAAWNSALDEARSQEVWCLVGAEAFEATKEQSVMSRYLS